MKWPKFCNKTAIFKVDYTIMSSSLKRLPIHCLALHPMQGLWGLFLKTEQNGHV